MNQSKKSILGFGLFEIMLVLIIAMTTSIYAMRGLRAEVERKEAVSIGEQVRTVSNAANGYIVNFYQPLTAAAATNITIADLRGAGLLPATFADTNIQGSNYTIRLVRTGAAPNWNIEGLIVVNNPVTDGLQARTVLSGVALQAIGADGGVSYDGASMSGMDGGWSAAQATYPAITQIGQIGARVGYGTSQFTQFLRRDGTLPMTGNLNMGAQSITAATNVTATGIVTSATANTGALNASGVSTLTGNVNAGSALAVAGTSTFTGAVTTGGAVTVGGHTSMLTGEVRTVVAENTSCAGYNNGAFAKSTNGVLLSCQDALWKKSGGSAGAAAYTKGIIEDNDGKIIHFTVHTRGLYYTYFGYVQFCASCSPPYGTATLYIYSVYYNYWTYAASYYPITVTAGNPSNDLTTVLGIYYWAGASGFQAQNAGISISPSSLTIFATGANAGEGGGSITLTSDLLKNSVTGSTFYFSVEPN